MVEEEDRKKCRCVLASDIRKVKVCVADAGNRVKCMCRTSAGTDKQINSWERRRRRTRTRRLYVYKNQTSTFF